MKTDLFQSCGHGWVFQICWSIECSTFTASFSRIWNSSTGIPLPPLALFVVMLSKAHLTSHSRMSGSRWMITPLWLSESWRSFLYSSSVYYSAIKIWVSFSEVDEPRACYTEWSKSEREKQIWYTDACIWSLERWHWRAGVERQTELVDAAGEGKGWTAREALKHVHHHMQNRQPVGTRCVTQGAQPTALCQPRGVGGEFKREETDAYLWLIRAAVWQKPTQHCKAIILN